MRTKRVRILLWVIFLMMLASLYTSTFLSQEIIKRGGSESRDEISKLFQIESSLESAESELAHEVAAWKSLVKPDAKFSDLNAHLKSLETHARGVNQYLSTVESSINSQESERVEIHELREIHDSITREYKNRANEMLENGIAKSRQQIDQKMRGVDREILSKLLHVRVLFESRVSDKLNEIYKIEANKAKEQQVFFITILDFFLPVLMVVVFVVVVRLLKENARASERARAIFRSIGDAVICTDNNGKIEYINLTAQRLLGRLSSESVGKRFKEIFEIYHEGDGKPADDPVDRVIREKHQTSIGSNIVVRSASGALIPITDSAAPVYDASGVMDGVVVVFSDDSFRREMVRRLEREQYLFHMTFSEAEVGIAHVSLDGRFLRVNRSLSEFLGYSEIELLKLTWQEITHPDHRESNQIQLSDMIQGRGKYQPDKLYLHKTGIWVWGNASAKLVHGDDGVEPFIVCVINDIQKRKRAEFVASSSLSRYQALFEKMPAGAMIINESQEVLTINHEGMNLLGHNIYENNILKLCDIEPHSENGDGGLIAKALTNGCTDKFETEFVHCKGHKLNINASVSAIRDGVNMIFQVIFHDITEQKKNLDKIEYLALHDHLTGLANRRKLQDSVGHAISIANRDGGIFFLMFIDLDNFKNVNDTMGHDAGDELLKIISVRLKECIRESDMLCRAGGDEFILMLNGVAKVEDAMIVADKIIANVSREIMISGRSLFITPSVGISVFPFDGSDFLTLSRHADLAMYQAKESGRNSYKFFLPELDSHISSQVEIEGELRRALKNHEFEIYYQPKVRLEDDKIIGVEALLRWNHPDHGLIMPDHFIDVAERSDLIVEIGSWVLKQVCTQLSIWNATGHDIVVSFNVSARELLPRSRIIEKLKREIIATQVKPCNLVLEITERILVNNEDSKKILEELASMGIKLALDDFGTGYSSLSYLRQFPIKILKIDREFINEFDVNSTDGAMVEAIINIAHVLNITTVAEGVETAEQRDMLASMRCDIAQGFFYSKALPVLEFQKRYLS